MIRQTQGAGFKLAATAIIWGFATGMLGICIPYSSFVICHSSFVIRHSSFVIRHLSFVRV
ncbi:hypothetical protein [Coleofasciculus sp. F4-SAH-05]|uniref:hypothetical protein n=1 Tax=Coleofasciculus sp. F4-SAH-05 TaxID=3069525 RepID=UPI003303D563